MIKKVCSQCGKKFVPNANSQKFCSAQCREKAVRPPKNIVRKCICKGCGNMFNTPRKKTYCSEECRMYANGRGTMYTKTEKK